MTTTYDEIYRRFLGKIKDYDLESSSLSEEDKYTILLSYLNSAIPNFYTCKQNLSDKDDVLSTFNITLSPIEQEILSLYMVSEWLRPQILSQDNLFNALGTKDYNIYSPGNLLDKLTKLKIESDKEVADLSKIYYYQNFGVMG